MVPVFSVEFCSMVGKTAETGANLKEDEAKVD